jgi:hypothetical protein
MILHRLGEPSKQDTAPYGSCCLAKMNSQSITFLYIQLSHDENEPSWTFIDKFEFDLTEEDALKITHKILYPD